MDTSPRLVARFSAVASLCLCVACEATLDPRSFDQLAYGMGHAHVEQALAAEVRDRLYVFPGAVGGATWVVDAYRSAHPHPDYLVAYRDGQLTSVLTEYDLPRGVHSIGLKMGADLVAATIDRFEARRHPLAWAQLRPIDSEHLSSEASPAVVVMFLVVACPPVTAGVLLLPVMWVTLPLIEGDVRALRADLSARACSLAPRSTYEEVIAALGEPQVRDMLEGQPDCEVWDYSVADRMAVDFSCRLGFIGGRLRWVQARLPAPWRAP